VLLRTVHQAPELHGISRSRWRLDDLQRVVPGLAQYSRSGVWRALRRLGVARRRGRLSLHSPDPAYREKMARVEAARAGARQEPERVRLLYGDEFSLHRQPTLGPVYAARGQAPKAPLSHHSNTRHRVAGALDVLDGRVIWAAGATMGVKGLRAFLGRLRAAYPGQEVVLVWDNWPVHYHPRVLARAAELEIAVLWLPTYAPWENPIEKLWRWIKQDLLHHHHLADRWAELKARVAAFLDQFAAGSADLLRYVGASPD
jgi:hypothetical protein